MNKQHFAGKVGILIFLITFVFVLINSFFYENKTLYTNFADEEDNFVSANYILSGQRLYKDIFGQHQPVPYLISAGLESVANPDSIFLLIKRHREFVIAWAAIWAFVITYSFGWIGLGFIVIYELTKHFLFGNFFLAESLAVYPLVFLIGKIVFPKEDKVKPLEMLLYGTCFSFLAFTLAPLWPVLVFLFLLLVLRHKQMTLKNIFVFVVGFLSVLGLVLPFVSVQGYIQDVILFNTKYYIPLSHDQLSLTSVIKSFLSPLLVFQPGLEKTPILNIIQTMSLVLMTGLIYLAKKKKFSLLLTSFIVLGLTNIRFIQPGLDFYRGFHLLSWYAVLILFISYALFTILQDKKQKVFLMVGVGLSLILGVLIVSSDTKTLFLKRDLSNDYYIYFSRQFDMGTAVSIMKSSSDTLFVYPDKSLIYWQAGIKKASEYIFFYPFMENVPPTMESIAKIFEESPPTYFYCNCEGSKLMKYLKMYTPVFKDGKATELYILSSRVKSVSLEQRNQLSFYKFSIPQ